MRAPVLLLIAAVGCAAAPDLAAPRRSTPPPTASAGESGRVVKAQLAIDPLEEPYRVTLPDELNVEGATYWAMVKMCVSAEGVPTSVTLIKRAHPDLDPKIVKALGNWRFKPYTLDGRGVPFCSNYRYEMSAR